LQRRNAGEFPTLAEVQARSRAAQPKPKPAAPAVDYSPEAIRKRDVPLKDEGLGPLSWLPLMRAGTVGYKGGEALAKPVANWLLNRAIRGAVSGASAGAVEAASREANPVPHVLGGAASGAALGPPIEGAAGALANALRGLRAPQMAPAAAPKPAPIPGTVESTPGALKPFSGPIVEPALPPRATPVVDRVSALNMAPEELAAAAKAESSHEARAAVDVFGAEKAKVYESNYRLANSSTAERKAADEASRIVKEMEDSLTEAQRNRLFGVGEGGFNADELRALSRAASDYHPEALAGMSDDELRNHLARAMTEGTVSGTDVASTRQALVLRNTLVEAQRRGWGPQQIQDAITERARALRMDPAEIAGLAQRRMDELAKPVTAGALPSKPAPIPGTVQPQAGAPAEVPLGPAKPTNAQQFPQLGTLRETIEADPQFMNRLQELGGGRVQTNAETLAKAWNEGPMPLDEIAGWQAETPLNTVQQTRALITLDYLQQQRLRAIQTGDLSAAAAANETIGRILPGVQNLRATGGRLTQAQAMFVQDEMTKALNELADMQAKGVPFEQVRERANELVRQANAKKLVGGMGKVARDWIGNLETAATFAKLTSPVTHIVNTTSNALTFATRIIEKPAAAATLAAQGNMNAARAEVSTIFGTTMGFRSGLQRYVATLLDDAAPVGKGVEVLKDRNIPLPKALRPFDVFRHLSAADAFWKGVLRDSRLHELAHASALDEGLAGPALAKRVTDLVNDPPANWSTEADAYAQEMTFQEGPDKFLSAVQKIQGLPFVKLFIPFAQTPYNLTKWQFQRSAAGILSPRNVSGLMAGGQAQASAVGRLTAGLALSGGGLALVSSTEVTGDYPKDSAERARWDAEGIKPYSIKVGDKYVAYNRFAPLGMYIGQAVMLRDALENGDEEGAAGHAARLFASSLKQVNDMPFMSGLSDMLAAIQDPEKSAKKFAQGIVTGFVPNALRDVRNQTDPVVRKPDGVGQAVANMLPGQSQKLPAKVDVLGRTVTLEPSRAVRATKVLSTRRDIPETRLMERLKWSPPMPDAKVTPLGSRKPITLKGAELERFQREMGEATRQAIQPFTMDQRFERMDRDAQVEYLDKAVQDARNKVRKRWRFELSMRAPANSAPLGEGVASRSTAAN